MAVSVGTHRWFRGFLKNFNAYKANLPQVLILLPHTRVTVQLKCSFYREEYFTRSCQTTGTVGTIGNDISSCKRTKGTHRSRELRCSLFFAWYSTDLFQHSQEFQLNWTKCYEKWAHIVPLLMTVKRQSIKVKDATEESADNFTPIWNRPIYSGRWRMWLPIKMCATRRAKGKYVSGNCDLVTYAH